MSAPAPRPHPRVSIVVPVLDEEDVLPLLLPRLRAAMDALPGGAEAEMTYYKSGPNRISIDHTGVPPEFRNQGIAIKLVEAGIADAQKEGTRIVPLCSYVAAQFRRHPDWAPLLA